MSRLKNALALTAKGIFQVGRTLAGILWEHGNDAHHGREHIAAVAVRLPVRIERRMEAAIINKGAGFFKMQRYLAAVGVQNSVDAFITRGVIGVYAGHRM